VINSLIEIAAACNHRVPPRDDRRLEASLCIGDGYIYVFKAAKAATEFAAWLAHEIETRVAKKSLPVEFHFRIGVHIGPVFRFWDPGREDWNYIGDGINGGNRVLNAMGKDTDDVVFVSSAIHDQLIAEHGTETTDNLLRQAMRSRGRHTDKQGKRWRIYELHVGTVFPM
jgi:class 3 adenylate cyclase